MSALLEIEGIETCYGSSQVLFGVNLTVGQGEVVTLLGRNGMGKTTTLRSVLGLTPARSGRIRLLGERIERLPPHRIARMGIAIAPEGRQIFPNLTVEENLVAFAENRASVSEPWTLDKVYAFFPRLKERARNLGNQLSGGEQQMLAIGRALMTNPHLLILDEATEGLAPLVREEIWRCLDALRASGQTILVVDKHIERLAQLANRHVVLEKGSVVWRGTSDAVRSDPEQLHRHLAV